MGIDINPSLDGHFCSVGNSGTVKVWKIPETFLEDDHNEVKIKQKKKKLNKKIVPLVG